ncbi:ATP-binding protein, partial [Falsiroseomonas oryzae]|uniref:ATP-binding protein n=1 Tax=Falsiroseomonas oryzae TaxID=2766473 RepID=UPI0022EAEC22
MRFEGRVAARDIFIGLDATPTDFTTAAGELVAAYRGTAADPAPFGGRDAELTQLTRWLSDPAAPGNFLITAPAGRGKTSLVVRWLDSLGARGRVAFLPISIRYGTSRSTVFHRALATRLATLLGEALPADTAIGYEDRIRDYLARFDDPADPCLLVIDGLDEATGRAIDGGILRRRPPPGLRVLVTARQLAGDRGSAEWLRRLGWTGAAATIELDKLDRAGIAAALRGVDAGLASLAEDPAVIAELDRLTEKGDPLLVGLYAGDLARSGRLPAGFGAHDLARRRPGLANYFTDWIEHQKIAWREAGREVDQDWLNIVLAVLGCALAPMQLAEIGRVAALVSGQDRIVTLDTLDPIRRFVAGAAETGGFVLSHPRFALHIQEDHFRGSDLIPRVRAGFLAWGEGVVAALNRGELPPGQVPRYLLASYLGHLDEVSPPPLDHYRALVEDGWRRAWEAAEAGAGTAAPGATETARSDFAEQVQACWRRLLEAAEADQAALRRPRTGLGG